MDEADLISEIENLKKDKISSLVERRIKEFENAYNADERTWFEELCFCLLTANTSAKMGLDTICGIKGVLHQCDIDELSNALKDCKYRFYNRRAQFIIGARGHATNLKREIENRGEREAREWLVGNVKGIGFKEASHFLRNVGYKNSAILDRHILKLLFEYGLIDEAPENLSEKKYYEIEKILEKLAKKTQLSLAKLDLYLWYMKTGEVLK